MRILQLVTDRQLRGAQIFAAQLADWLHAQGHEVKLAVLYKSDVDLLTTQSVPIIALSGTRKMFSLSLARRLRKVIVDFSPVVIQANGSDTLKYAVMASIGLRSKPVLVYRNISMVGSWVRPGVQRRLYNFLFSRVGHVASLTARTKKEFTSVYSFPESKISVIPVGVEQVDHAAGAARSNLIKLTGASQGSIFIVHIGAFSKEKNHVGLIRIFDRIKKEIPGAVLVLAGSGPLLGEIQASVGQKSRSVFFLGPRPDIHEWLGGADALFLPSLIEGLPGVVLEAMASRVPVVAYDVGAIGEVVVNGRAGFLAPVNDEDEFVRRALVVLSDEGLRMRMGEEGFARIRKEFLIGDVCRRFEAVYIEAIGTAK